MKKKNDFEEFLRQLEETLGKMLDEIDITENRPVDIGISVNVFPVIVFNSEEPILGKEVKTPVDILETEKNIHALIGLPGMEKENINISCNGKALEVTAFNDRQNLKETIELPAKVIKSGMKASYDNGVLEIVFTKSKKRKTVKKSNT